MIGVIGHQELLLFRAIFAEEADGPELQVRGFEELVGQVLDRKAGPPRPLNLVCIPR